MVELLDMVAPSGSRKDAWRVSRGEWPGAGHHERNAAGAPAEAKQRVEDECDAVNCVS